MRREKGTNHNGLSDVSSEFINRAKREIKYLDSPDGDYKTQDEILKHCDNVY